MALTYNKFKATTIYGEFRNEDNTSGNTTLPATATFNGNVVFNGNVSLTNNTKRFRIGEATGNFIYMDTDIGVVVNAPLLQTTTDCQIDQQLYVSGNTRISGTTRLVGDVSSNKIINGGDISTNVLYAVSNVVTANINGTTYTPCSTYFSTASPPTTGFFQMGGSAGAPTCNFNGAISSTNGVTMGNGNDLNRARRNLNIDNCLRVGYNDATDVSGNLSLLGNVVTSGGNKIETNGNIGCATITTTAAVNCGTTLSVTGNATLSSETKIPLAGSLLFGSNASSRQQDAGRICYNTFDYFTDGNGGNGYMHIIGSGGGFPGRGIRMWDIVDIYQQLKVPEIILNGNNLATTMANYLDFSGLTVYANTGTPLAVVKSGTAAAPVLTFTIPTTSASGTNPTLRIGNVLVSTSYSTIGATLTGTTDMSLSFTFPDYVTSNTTQTITGTKTMGNLKLNASLQLTTPAVNISQTELSYLSGLTGNIQSQIGNCAPVANPTFTSDMTFSKSTAINISSSANKTVNLFTTNTTDVNPINIGNSSSGFVNINNLNITDTITMPSVGDVKTSILGKANSNLPVFTGNVTFGTPNLVADVQSQIVNLFTGSTGNINIGSSAATVKTTCINTTCIAVNQSTITSGYMMEINGGLKVNGNIVGNFANSDMTVNSITATQNSFTGGASIGKYYLTIPQNQDDITPPAVSTNIATYKFQFEGADYDKQNIGSFQYGNFGSSPVSYPKFWTISNNIGSGNSYGTTDTADFNSMTGKLGCREGTYDINIQIDSVHSIEIRANFFIGSVTRSLLILPNQINTFSFSNIVVGSGGASMYIRPILNPPVNGLYGVSTYLLCNVNNTFIECIPAYTVSYAPSITAPNIVCTNTFNLLPPGMISSYIGTTDPPGWLICDGRSLVTTAYPTLFYFIKYRYGGSGIYFNIPNFKGAFMRGAGTQSFPTEDGRTLTYYGGNMSLPQVPHQGTFISEQDAYTDNLKTADIPNQRKGRFLTSIKNIGARIVKFKEDLYNATINPITYSNPFNAFSSLQKFDDLVEVQPFSFPVNWIIKI